MAHTHAHTHAHTRHTHTHTRRTRAHTCHTHTSHTHCTHMSHTRTHMSHTRTHTHVAHTCHTRAHTCSRGQGWFANLSPDGNLSFQCFTRGFEYKKHKSDHKYEIMVSDSSVPFRPIRLQRCTLSFNFRNDNRPRTSPSWSLGGRRRRKWLCWRPSWTAALGTGEWIPQSSPCWGNGYDRASFLENLWYPHTHFLSLSWLIWCVSLLCRQDVAYQMRTKTKEECESHYMKNFINNPLFSSTLLSLRKTKDSHFAEGAIPFRRQYPLHLRSLLLFLCWREIPLHLFRSYSWAAKLVSMFVCLPLLFIRFEARYGTFLWTICRTLKKSSTKNRRLKQFLNFQQSSGLHLI